MRVLRPAARDDAEAICRVHKASILRLCAADYSEEQLEAWIGPRQPADYLPFIRDQHMLVAQTTDADGSSTVVGFSIFGLETGVLFALYIDPEHAGSGIGSELLAAVETAALGAGLRTITLNATLGSVPFYERHGYRSLGRSWNTLPSGVDLPCMQMEKRLADCVGSGG